MRAAPNRLLGQPAPTAPNRVWVGYITYLPRQGGGWLYLAVWLERARDDARRPGQRSAAPGPGRTPPAGWARRAL
ncbi:MAG TPA: hypothetical protein VF690_14515 [Hymenobacter sp.]